MGEWQVAGENKVGNIEGIVRRVGQRTVGAIDGVTLTTGLADSETQPRGGGRRKKTADRHF